MIKKTSLFILLCFIQKASAQLTTSHTLSPTQMVQNVLLGAGITVSNVSYTGYANGIATFNATPSVNLGFSSGIYLTSGSYLANDPLGGFGSHDGPFGPSSYQQSVDCHTAGDVDLGHLTTGQTHDAAVLEFDFIPKSDTVKFRYRFASEEYNEYVGTTYNDVFGFFLSGVTVTLPATNIALIPGTASPVSINNVNNGYSMGTSNGPCTNCAYYKDNTTNSPTSINTIYDGCTKILTAIYKVQCGQKYHIKIAIADVSDALLDSGVFLEAGSFSSQDPITISSNLLDTTVTEGCGAAILYFVRPQSQTANAVTYTYTFSGTATNGADISPALSGSVTFPVGVDTVAIPFSAVNDGITEPVEVLNINLVQTFTICGQVKAVSGAIFIKPPISASITSQTPVACYGGTNGSASLSSPSGGTSPYTYSWAPNTSSSPNVSNLGAGTYTCTITDALGCSGTKNVSITQPTQALADSISSQSMSNCSGTAGGSATITVSGGTTPYNYAWTPNVSTTNSISNVAAGTYSCAITDANGCSAAQTVVISQPVVFTLNISSQTNVTCNGYTNGAASITVNGGATPFTYSWTPNSSTTNSISNVAAGTYTCNVSDANGCNSAQTVTITQPSVITSTATHTNVSCNGGSNGSASCTPAGGTTPYTYSWTPNNSTTNSINNVAAGTYTCHVSDVNGCSGTQTFTITQPSVITATATHTNVSCNGGSNGSASGTTAGGTTPYTYSWTPTGSTSSTISGLSAGTYLCAITDAHNCPSSISVSITEPAALAFTSYNPPHNVSCHGGSNGSFDFLTSGGTMPYTFSWTGDSSTTSGISNVVAGTYICTITDVHNCTDTLSVTITEPLALSSDTGSQSPVTCFGDSTGSASITVSGGTLPYSYSWTANSSTTVSISNAAAGTYVCFITDANLCTGIQSVTIDQPPPLLVTTLADPVCKGFKSLIGATATGGNGNYTYLWNPNGLNTSSFTSLDLSPVMYTVIVSDSKGCSTTQTISSVIHSLPTASISSNAVNGIYILTGHEGTLCYTDNTSGANAWNWAFNNSANSTTTNPCFNVNSPGTYCTQLIVQNSFGCADTINDCVVVEKSIIVIPNIFTPNLDGTNDVFTINVKGYHDLNCEIYDRWGLKVFEWQGLSGGWDGILSNGNQASDGTYYWIVNLFGDSGESTNQSGYLLLTR